MDMAKFKKALASAGFALSKEELRDLNKLRKQMEIPEEMKKAEMIALLAEACRAGEVGDLGVRIERWFEHEEDRRCGGSEIPQDSPGDMMGDMLGGWWVERSGR